jgi:hypothetical protein
VAKRKRANPPRACGNYRARLAEIAPVIESEWMGVSNSKQSDALCLTAARCLKIVAKQLRIPFHAMACTVAIGDTHPDVDDVRGHFDKGWLKPMHADYWPWGMVVVLGGFDDPWLFDLAAGQYAKLLDRPVGFPELSFPPIVRGPLALDVAYENGAPVAIAYAEQGLFIDLRSAPMARAVQLAPTGDDSMMANALLRTIRATIV